MPRTRRRTSPAGQGGGRGGASSGLTGGGGGGRGRSRSASRDVASDGGTRADGQGAAATARRGTTAVVRRAISRIFVIGVAVIVVLVAGTWWSDAADNGARAWDATAVQLWFEEHKEGKWLKYAGKFERLNGEDMSELSKEDLRAELGGVIGGAIYNDWRATCCAAGWADLLWSPRGAALALVVAAGVVWADLWFIQPLSFEERVEAVQRETNLKPAKATEFVRFADALRSQKRTQLTAGTVVDFGTFTLNDKHKFEGPRKIYVRECYVPLVEEYFNDDVNPTRCRVIIGNPGIGKSVFRLLVACKALAEGLDVAFAKFDGDDHDVYIVSADGRHDRVRAKGASIGNDLRAADMVVVADVGEGHLQLVEDIHSPRCWYFTSPQIKRDPRKSGNTFLWLPLWTLAELLEAAQLLNLSLKHTNDHLLPDPAIELLYAGDAHGADRARIVEMRCYQFGGVARVVLAEDEDVILSHLESVQDALHDVVENGEDAVVLNLFHAKRSKFESAHTIVGVRTSFGVGGDMRRWFKYARDVVPDVSAYPDDSGATFLQLPVDWLSRPLRELGFQHLVRRHDLANLAVPFGSWPAGVRGVFHERFAFNRIVLAAQAKAAVFEKLHRIKAKATAAARWRPADLSATVQASGVSGFDIARQYVDLPDVGGYDTMTQTLTDAIADSRKAGTHKLLVPLSDRCPAFDGVLVLGGAEVEVLFLQVTLQGSHGIGADNTGARKFFEAALQVVHKSGAATRVAVVYVLRFPDQYRGFREQTQAGWLASRVAQYKALPTAVAE